ncbi:MAG: DUF2235 domain-containing protein [Rhodospirillaceae bacterium]|nr:DUF2235 domain-containing protein [Rhodospirillaceae bacterium]
MKRIIICCDGTWKGLSSIDPTNIGKTALTIAPHDSQGIEQVVFYSDGLGTRPSVASRAASLLGIGLDRSIEHAYRFLIFNYNPARGPEPADEIFMFGFSRGAYAVRSLVGLIRKCGVLPREYAGVVGEALELYRDDESVPISRQHPDDPRSRVTREFHARYRVKLPRIRFLGVWDTVGALGLPGRIPFSRRFSKRFQFHDTRLSRIVDHACHAVALDERRKVFATTLFDTAAKEGQAIEQVWFPGNHNAVGGGTPVRGLSDTTFAWMMQRATNAGLALIPGTLEPPFTKPDPLGPFERRIIADRRNPLHYLYRALGAKTRLLPDDPRQLDISVFERWRRDPGYRPKYLAAKYRDILDQ